MRHFVQVADAFVAAGARAVRGSGSIRIHRFTETTCLQRRATHGVGLPEQPSDGQARARTSGLVVWPPPPPPSLSFSSCQKKTPCVHTVVEKPVLRAAAALEVGSQPSHSLHTIARGPRKVSEQHNRPLNQHHLRHGCCQEAGGRGRNPRRGPKPVPVRGHRACHLHIKTLHRWNRTRAVRTGALGMATTPPIPGRSLPSGNTLCQNGPSRCCRCWLGMGRTAHSGSGWAAARRVGLACSA